MCVVGVCVFVCVCGVCCVRVCEAFFCASRAATYESCMVAQCFKRDDFLMPRKPFADGREKLIMSRILIPSLENIIENNY